MKITLLHSLLVSAMLVAGSSGCARKSEAVAAAPAETIEASSAVAPAEAAAAEKPLPRLVDIGAGTCIPCKMMAPILDELKQTRAHQFETIFVDLNSERERARSFGIRVIPTQVFFDEDGRELIRHEGFLSKEDILLTWERVGYRFGATD